jgi:phage-related protein
MAYINPFSYNRDSSVDSKYKYVADLSKFKPIYGSSVSFSSRLNYLQTVDNTLKILPASENNLVAKYNLKFLLADDDAGSLLKTIEIAGGYKYLKFTDPSNFYKDIIGLVEDYSINKSSQNLNEINIIVSSYFKSPMFNWRTSSFFNIDSSYDYSSSKNYNKYDVVYRLTDGVKNKIDNFWFAKQDISASNNSLFDSSKWSKYFIYETKLPFELKNKFDIHQLDYKNSFIQNIKHKENSNTLKQYSIKFENISDKQCFSILLFLEKKCGYRRFIYDFPFLLKRAKVFICTEWNHVLKYVDCNDVTATFVEDPNPDMNDFKIEGAYDGFNFINNAIEGFFNGLLYTDLNKNILYNLSSIAKIYVDKLYYISGALANGAYSQSVFRIAPQGSETKYFIKGNLGEGIWIRTIQSSTSTSISWGMKFKENGLPLFDTISILPRPYITQDLTLRKYNGLYLHGSIYDTVVTGTAIQLILGTDGLYTKLETPNKILYYYDSVLYDYNDKNGTFYTYVGLFRNLFLRNGIPSSTVASDYTVPYLPYDSYLSGYPELSNTEKNNNRNLGINLLKENLYNGSFVASGYVAHTNGILYNVGRRFTGIYQDKFYFLGLLTTGNPVEPRKNGFFYINGIKLANSDIGMRHTDGYWYQYGMKIISNGYFNGFNFINGVKQE